MHSRRKGVSGSKKPLVDKKHVWVRYGPSEVEVLVNKLAKSGLSQSMIGITLRDSYGIPDVKKITGKSIVKILRENNLTHKIPEDLIDLIKRDIKLSAHGQENKKDMTAKRGSLLTLSKIRRLAKYYKNEGVLPTDWEYRREQAKLLIS